MRSFLNWLFFRDYNYEKDIATDHIIKKQSRGNVSIQNGWYINLSKMLSRSKRADKDVRYIDRALKRYHAS